MIKLMQDGKFKWSPILALGSLWGLSEAAGGMFLRGVCARFISGSVLTGMAIFFMATAFFYSRKKSNLLVLLLFAIGFKLLDALLLKLPVLHGAIGNPIFGFYTEAFAFIAMLWILKPDFTEKPFGAAVLGAITALVAVNLFPLVRFFTGIPACVVPGTQYPLSLYYAPIAIGFSAFSSFLGMTLGKRMSRVTDPALARIPDSRLAPIFIRAIPLFCLALILLIRLA
ncbi:hypothetical protein JW926_08725 [Candidatus Sumerlaeota bacterium]|nr:hypothetical protein [Candidatus Sumerlaeota bacterium]